MESLEPISKVVRIRPMTFRDRARDTRRMAKRRATEDRERDKWLVAKKTEIKVIQIDDKTKAI